MRKAIHRAYRTELDPNQAQRVQFLRHAGASRFTYNWGLERVRDAYKAGAKVPSAMDLHKELVRLKKTKLPWMYEVSKCATQEALQDLEGAYRRFLKDRKRLARRIKERKTKPRKDGMPWGFPRFKSRKRRIWRFTLVGRIRVSERAIRLPKIGWVRLQEKGYLPTVGVHLLSAAISERAGYWSVSLHVEQEIEVPDNHGPVVGIDLGISRLITVSDGTTIENPRALKRYDRKLRRLQRSASRKRPGSWKQAQVYHRIGICHVRISNIRKDAIHKATTMLARTKSAIGVESLNVRGMMKNHSLAGSIADAGWGTIIRQLKYKATWRGSALFPAKGDFPSTRRCSRCGWVSPELPLSQRIFHCERRDLEMDRDLNAAKNNERVALVALSCRETVNARESWEVSAPVTLVAVAVPGAEAGTEAIASRTAVLDTDGSGNGHHRIWNSSQGNLGTRGMVPAVRLPSGELTP